MVLRTGIDSPVRAAWFTMASLSSTMPSSGIGSMEMQKLKPYHMENLYTTLSKTPCGSYVEGKKQELTEKQKQRFLSGTTSPQAVPAEGEPTISMTALLELLKNADPEVKAQLRLALLT